MLFYNPTDNNKLIDKVQKSKQTFFACFRVAGDRVLGCPDQLQTASGAAAAAQGRQVELGTRCRLPRQRNVPLDARLRTPNMLPKFSAPNH